MTVLVTLVVCESSVLTADNLCVFNSTHCSCRMVGIPGTCLRHQGNNHCIVDNCSSDGMVCDCSADQMCKRFACEAWVSVNTSSPVNHFRRGTRISCVSVQNSLCLTKTGQKSVSENPANVAASPEKQDVPGSSEEAVTSGYSGEPAVKDGPEFRMVQVGIASNSTMFNMTAFVDKDDLIAHTFDMDEMWQDNEYLRRRFITMRLYDSPVKKERILCAIYNKYGEEDDQLGSMSVFVQISSTAAQPLQWKACDGLGECKGKKGSTLSAYHSLHSSSADGWCVKPVKWNGSGIRVKFYLVNGMAGLALQSTGKTVRDRAFLFRDIVEIGQLGYLNDDGLVVGGAMPDILFNMRGIQVPKNVDEGSEMDEI